MQVRGLFLSCLVQGTALVASISAGNDHGALQFAAAVSAAGSSDAVRQQGQPDANAAVQHVHEVVLGTFSRNALLLTRDNPWTADDMTRHVTELFKRQLVGKDSRPRFELADDHGNSVRLGNMLDHWWYQLNFRSRGGIETKDWKPISPYQNWAIELDKVLAGQCPSTKRCFGSYLARQIEQVQNNTLAQRTHSSDRLKIANWFMSQDYAVYEPHWVKDYMMPEMAHDFMKEFRHYANAHDPQLLRASHADAVVHYRVGDVLSNEPPIHPRSIAKALASLSPPPKTIEVLNGGFKFAQGRTFEAHLAMAISSVKLLRMLSDEIFEVLPNTTITMPTIHTAEASTVDQDWAKLVTAKSVVRVRLACPLFCIALLHHSAALLMHLQSLMSSA